MEHGEREFLAKRPAPLTAGKNVPVRGGAHGDHAGLDSQRGQLPDVPLPLPVVANDRPLSALDFFYRALGCLQLRAVTDQKENDPLIIQAIADLKRGIEEYKAEMWG